MLHGDQPLNRRAALKLIGGGALAAGLTGGGARSAAAGRTWCRTDPVLKINGRSAQVYVGAPVAMKQQATGPIELIVEVPDGVDARSTPGDNGFGHGWQVTIRVDPALTATASYVPVRLSVYCPATSDLPIEVGMRPKGKGTLRPGVAYGAANVRYVSVLC